MKFVKLANAYGKGKSPALKKQPLTIPLGLIYKVNIKFYTYISEKAN